MKVGKTGKAALHAAYIAREGKFAQRLERGEKLEATEAGNMPAWATAQPQQFWLAADAFERLNGTTYREMEIALPRELKPSQRADLVRAFVHQEIGELHAYQWAIHTPLAADGGEQPHVHLMFSERQIDGIDRDPGEYFKRYNAKSPEKGGARKGYGPSAGQTLSAVERSAELKELRGRWEAMCNDHLVQAGYSDQRIDMRSYAERGIDLEPERKQLPSAWRGQGKNKVIELRSARQEAFQAQRDLAIVIPDIQAEILRQKKAEQKRLQEEAKQAEEAERQRIERMSSTELVATIRKLRQPSLAISDLVADTPSVKKANAELRTLQVQRSEADRALASTLSAIKAWREAHKLKVWFHDREMGYSPELRQLEELRDAQQVESQALGPKQQAAEKSLESARHVAHHAISASFAPALARAMELEVLLQDKLRAEQAEKKRVEAEKARIEAERRVEREREAVLQGLIEMAAKREMNESGWDDNGGEWAAAPESLRKLINDYNAVPRQEQPALLKELLHNETFIEGVQALMDEQRSNYRDDDLGLSF